jgi:hypothetical protein
MPAVEPLRAEADRQLGEAVDAEDALEQLGDLHTGEDRRACPQEELAYFLGCTVCLRLAPGVNFGALDALIFTFSPVRGLTP